MNIISTQYTLKYKSFEIVISGCKGENGIHCKECHSPETWNFNIGNNYLEWFPNLLNKINDNSNMINWIWIYGGEPNDNDLDDLKNMLLKIKSLNKPILLFTRYSLESVPDFEKQICDYIKCGEYKPELKTDNNICYGIKLATSNQYIYKKGLDY